MWKRVTVKCREIDTVHGVVVYSDLVKYPVIPEDSAVECSSRPGVTTEEGKPRVEVSDAINYWVLLVFNGAFPGEA